MKKHNILPTGFTLVEVAMVVLVGGIVMAASTSMLNDSLQESRVSLTQSRMQDIDNAIGQYIDANGFLPCPAPLNDAQDSSTFGKSINDAPLAIPPTPPSSPSDCYATAIGSPSVFTAANGYPPPSAPLSSPDIVIGAVPVRDLNLPDQEMADSWGDRFVYAVSYLLTVSGSYNPALGVIGVVDGTGTALVGTGFKPPSYAQYVIVSYGADRAGAYTLAGVTGGTACPAVTSLENMNCSLSTTTNTFRKAAQVTISGSGYFDDYVLYHSQMSQTSTQPSTIPAGLIEPFASLTACPTGWAAYGSAPGTGTGVSPNGITATAGTCIPPTGGICCQSLY